MAAHLVSEAGGVAREAPAPRPVAVELRSITARYKGVAALNAVDLAIGEGEFFSLLGPSGCGKTTTLNIIGGFVQPDEGDVLIGGRSVRHMPAYKRPVNTVFQSMRCFPHDGGWKRRFRTTAGEVPGAVARGEVGLAPSHCPDEAPAASSLAASSSERVALLR